MYPKTEARLVDTARPEEVHALICENESLIARGNGRSYGDSSLHHSVFSTLRLNRFLQFDKINETLSCESGVLLEEILNLIIPEGFFLPVIPGTKFISLGGAIAADVHGKNHAREGSFSRHLVSFDLLRSDGKIRNCSRTENPELFYETCGGMGLTGIILRATIRIRKTETAYFRQRKIKTQNLADTIHAFEKYADSSYRVAWIDCLSRGKKSGRGILTIGEHARLNELPPSLTADPLTTSARKRLNIPVHMPGFVMNAGLIRLFNTFYYSKTSGTEKESFVHYEPFLFPLDAIGNWNRLYGKRGFVQYQFVLPEPQSGQGLEEVLQLLGKAQEGSFLAVLKHFGKTDPNFPFSFPQPGYSLAVDFRVKPETFQLMKQLDEIVQKYSGKIYLVKDARMSSGFFHRTYPGQKSRDPYFKSAQSVRLEW